MRSISQVAPTICPFCESIQNCSHHLASIDLEDGEIYEGALLDNEYRVLEPIQNAFLAAFLHNDLTPRFLTCIEIAELWQSSTFHPDDDYLPVDIPEVTFLLVVAKYLTLSGAVRLDHTVNIGTVSVPACSLYAEDCERVLRQYDKTIRGILGSEAIP